MRTNEMLRTIYVFVRFAAFAIIPKLTLSIDFKRHVGYKLNLKDPKTYNEKLQWLKLNWFDPKATICADKYTVREFVAEKGLGHTLNELYCVYDCADNINFEELPDQFVMKVTHGCGQNLVCLDKSQINWEAEKKTLNKWLKMSHYYNSLEWVYKGIIPRIVVEKLIQTEDGKLPKDYKVFCFNGEPKCIYVVQDRSMDPDTKRFDFYDCNWNHINVKNHYPNSEKILPKPKELGRLLDYSRVLSAGFPHARIDFYIENGNIIFGECTFFHFSGHGPFEPMEFDYKMGEYLTLPKLQMR